MQHNNFFTGSFLEKRLCFMAGPELGSMDMYKDAGAGTEVKKAIDKLDDDDDDGTLEDADYEHYQKQLKSSIKSINKVFEVTDQKDLPDSVKNHLKGIQDKITSLDTFRSKIVEVSKDLGKLEEKIILEKMKDFSEGGFSPDLIKTGDKIEDMAEKMEKGMVGGEGLLTRLKKFMSGELGMMDFVMSFFDEKDTEVNDDVEKAMDVVGDENAMLAKSMDAKKDHADSFSEKLLYAGVQTEAEWSLFQDGKVRTEVPATKETEVTKTQTLKDLFTTDSSLPEVMRNKFPVNPPNGAFSMEAWTTAMKAANLPVPDKNLKIPKGHHLYFNDKGLLIGVRKDKVEPADVTRNIYTDATPELENDEKKSEIDFLAHSMKKGDFLLVRGNGEGQMGDLLRNEITSEQGGFPMTHIMTYLGGDKILNFNKEKGGHIITLKEFLLNRLNQMVSMSR